MTPATRTRSTFSRQTRTRMTAGALTAILIGVAAALYAARSGGHPPQSSAPAPQPPFTDYRSETAGAIHKITVADLPAPFATQSVDNGPSLVKRPEGAMPQAMEGYSVSLYAEGLEGPRLIRRAPNGDLFVVESEAGRIKVLRGRGANGQAETIETFATGLQQPFGIAFYPAASPTHLYVANTDAVVRFPYQDGDLKARAERQVVVPELPGGGRLRGGGHWTRDIAFSNDGKKMFVSVGSHSNVDDPDTTPAEKERADVLEFNVDGTGRRIYASGIRNPVGIAVQPQTGQLWVSVNERDGLGHNLVPDYITHVEDGGFYGWPWYYMGGHQDPRHKGKRPELKSRVKTPDVLLQPHSASLQMLFYDGEMFPPEHRQSIFAAEHGSWNKSVRTGYKVIRVPLTEGSATGEYQDFLTGFVTPEGDVWGRPVGVAVASDGALIVTDDGSNTVWRVAYDGPTTGGTSRRK